MNYKVKIKKIRTSRCIECKSFTVGLYHCQPLCYDCFKYMKEGNKMRRIK